MLNITTDLKLLSRYKKISLVTDSSGDIKPCV